MKKADKALALLQANKKFSKQPNAQVYGAVGDAYAALGDKQQEKEWYQKSLVLNPTGFALLRLKGQERLGRSWPNAQPAHRRADAHTQPQHMANNGER